MMLRETGRLVIQMPTIPHHATTDTSRGPNGQVRERAVERAVSQPRLGRQLQGPAHEISNHIGVADNNFKFVLLPVLVVVGRLGPLKILFKGRFDASVIVVRDLNNSFRGLATWNVMAGSAFIQERIRFLKGDTGQVGCNNVGRFNGSCHSRHANTGNVAGVGLARFGSLEHLRQSTPREIGLKATEGRELSLFVFLVRLVVLAVSDQYNVPSHPVLSNITHALSIFFVTARRLWHFAIPIVVPQGIFHLGLPLLTERKQILVRPHGVLLHPRRLDSDSGFLGLFIVIIEFVGR
mmetsp:Transcript_4363/g.9198  ORF Transcript_4363/g.9198 Transcript_4363/m.9198 type:complete len:294 (-) Transcript_4363:225-1106(-)